MIYTVTFNPSLDYYVNVNNVRVGMVNRTIGERLEVGGKGINISLALRELDEDTKALGFVAGFTGNYIKDKIKELGLDCDFIEVQGLTRINVKIRSNNETDINGTGAHVTDEDVAKMARKLKKEIQPGDWLVVSGSVPPSLSDTAYADLFRRLKGVKDVKIVIDACGKLLTNTLPYHPFLIKPNIYELCEIFGYKYIPSDLEELFACARKLQKEGARNVIVSMGSGGAIMVTETMQSLYIRAAKGQLVNSVGAGDSMIAGFIHEYLRSGNYFSSLNYATAAGSACAFTKNLATKAQIEYIESLML
ncbi:MAG: 1-phosphofructokinase [Clostridia bacterium]|nr:1-phosphofructokinase [Clostridia bacterium]